MKILAFDPGLARTGFAIFATRGNSYTLLDYGCLFTDKSLCIEDRISSLLEQTKKLVQLHKPEAMIIEKLFFNINKKTVIAVAQAQGALLAIAGQYKLKVHFLTPLQIKQTLTGYGRSDKKNVQKMVGLLLKMTKMPEPDDVVDAIACGLAYCSIKKFDSRIIV